MREQEATKKQKVTQEEEVAHEQKVTQKHEATKEHKVTQEEEVVHEQKVTQEEEIAQEQKVVQDQDATQVREAAQEQKKLRKRKSAQKRKAVQDENAGLTTEQPATKRSPTKSIPVQASPARSTATRTEPHAVEPKDVPLPQQRIERKYSQVKIQRILMEIFQLIALKMKSQQRRKSAGESWEQNQGVPLDSRTGIPLKILTMILNFSGQKQHRHLREKRKKRERKAARSNVDVLMPLMGESNFGRGKRTKRQQR